MFTRSNVHMHNNRSSSKCSKDCLYAGRYELYYCNATISLGLYNLQVYLYSSPSRHASGVQNF